MPKKSQIVQCQCGTIYVTKNLSFQRSFHCPECGQSSKESDLSKHVFSHSNNVRKLNNSSQKVNLKSNLLSMMDKFSLSGADRHGYFKFNNLKVLDAQLYVHWLVLAASTLILIIYWESPINIVLAILSYLSIIFIHEAGHAAMASKVGCRVFAIRIGLVHGLCEYEQPKYELDDIKISWSGVILQILIAILVFSLSSFGLINFSFFAPILVFLGYFSLLIVPYNLMPLRGLDGQKAWRIIPFLYQQLKSRKN